MGKIRRYKKSNKQKRVSWQDYCNSHTAIDLKGQIESDKERILSLQDDIKELSEGHEKFRELDSKLSLIPDLPIKYRNEGGFCGLFAKRVSVPNTVLELETENKKQKIREELNGYIKYSNLYPAKFHFEQELRKLETTLKAKRRAYKTLRKEDSSLLESDLNELNNQFIAQSSIVNEKSNRLIAENPEYAKEFVVYNDEERESWMRNKLREDLITRGAGSISWCFSDGNGKFSSTPTKEQLSYFHFMKSPQLEDFFLEKNKASAITSEIRLIRNQLNQLEKNRVKKEKAEVDRAMLSRVKGASRQEGVRVKSGITISKECPYCMGDIGDTPHADHIYPIALGG